MADKKKSKRALRLFVWQGFAPDYTDGLAIAIAKDESEARKLIIDAYCDLDPGRWGELTIMPLTRKVAFAVGGGG